MKYKKRIKKLSLIRVTKSYILALGTTQISSKKARRKKLDRKGSNRGPLGVQKVLTVLKKFTIRTWYVFQCANTSYEYGF